MEPVKSTLLKLITGLETPDKGKIVTGETVVFGHYGQEGLQLKEDKRVIEVITDIAEFIPLEKGQKLTAALLERFLFTREQQQVYASQLSGGEKRRLYLLTVLMKNPNFLILDEPTNEPGYYDAQRPGRIPAGFSRMPDHRHPRPLFHGQTRGSPVYL